MIFFFHRPLIVVIRHTRNRHSTAGVLLFAVSKRVFPSKPLAFDERAFFFYKSLRHGPFRYIPTRTIRIDGCPIVSLRISVVIRIVVVVFVRKTYRRFVPSNSAIFFAPFPKKRKIAIVIRESNFQTRTLHARPEQIRPPDRITVALYHARTLVTELYPS